MKLTGVGVAGTALGTGTGVQTTATSESLSTESVITQEDYESFIALSESLRVGVNTTDPVGDGIEIGAETTEETIYISGDVSDGSWSAGTDDIGIPNLVTVLLDIIDQDDFDLFGILDELLSEDDLAVLDAFIADVIDDLDVRELLSAIDTEQLFAPIVEILKGLELPGDDERDGEGAGRQIINELGWYLGIQETFENPDDLVEEDIEDLRFENTPVGNEVVTLSGLLDGEEIVVLADELFSTKTIDDDIANIDSVDDLLTNPSVDKFIQLFDRIEESLVLELTLLGQGDTLEILPQGVDFATEDEPRLDRIVDMVLAVLNSDEEFITDLFENGDNGDNGDNGSDFSVSCTADGPVVEESDDDDDDGDLLDTIEEFLIEELGLPEDFFDADIIRDFIDELVDAVDLPDDLLGELTDLDEDGSGFDAGYIGSVEELFLDPIADLFDPDESWGSDDQYDSVLAEIPGVIEDALDFDALDGSDAEDTLDEVGAILRGELDEFDDDVDEYDNGLELELGIDGIGGDFDSDESLLTASIDGVELELKTAGPEPELVGDLINAFLDDAEEITVEDEDETPNVVAKGADALFEDVSFTSDEIDAFESVIDVLEESLARATADEDEDDPSLGFLPGLLFDALRLLFEDDEENGDNGNNGDNGDDEGIFDIILDELLDELEETQFGEFIDQFSDDDGEDPVWELEPGLELTTDQSGELDGEFTLNEAMATAEVTTVENEFNLDLGTLIDILTGADGETIGIEDIDIVGELESVELTELSLENLVTEELDQEDWDDLRDTFDDLLSGLSSDGFLEDPDDPDTAVCEYPWGEDNDDGDFSAGNEWENGDCQINSRDGACNVTFVAEEYNGDLAQFIEESVTSLATHIDTEVGGVENLIASEEYGLLNALDNVPGYAEDPDGPSPLERVVDIVIDLLNVLVDTDDNGDGLFRDFTGAHAVDLEFDLTFVPTEPVTGGFDGPPLDISRDGLLEDVNGDGDVDISDTQALFDNMDSAAIQDNPAAFNFSNVSPDDEVTIFDVAAHWRRYVAQD